MFALIAVLRMRTLRVINERERRTRGIELTGDREDGIPFVRKLDPEGKVELTPSRGSAANIAAATAIVLAGRLGFPFPRRIPWSELCSGLGWRVESSI